MYWFGQILTIVLGILGVAIIRTFILSRLSGVNERHLDTVFFIILVSVFTINWIIHDQENKQTSELKGTVNALRNYSEVARLNPYGLMGVVGPGLTERSPTSKVLEGAWIERNGKIVVVCDDSSLEKFRRVINFYPSFPWTYYALAVCLRTRGEQGWRDYAKKAIQIFESTTLLAGHHPSHDEGFKELRGYLDAP